MLRIMKNYEIFMVRILIVMMGLVLALAVIDLGWIIGKDIAESRFLILRIDQLLEIFGMFLLVLIGLELLETVMKTYITQGHPHYEVVLTVAIIAVARKVIIIEVKETPALVLIGIAALILGLTIGYYFMKRSHAVSTVSSSPNSSNSND